MINNKHFYDMWPDEERDKLKHIAFDVFNLTASTLNPSKILAVRAIEAAGGEVCEEA